MIKYYLAAFAVILIITNIKAQTEDTKEKVLLKQADTEFSDYSKLHGMKDAFLAYASEDAVLLRPKSYPIEGIGMIKEFFGDENPPFTLTWKPLFADVSSSLDMGYTYGTFELEIMDDNRKTQVKKGTYVSIWKKDSRGNWKWVLDTGNPGLE